jgi:streptogramin lyase
MPESTSLQPGQRFGNGRFVLVRFLGRGGMGEVWLAQDERLHEQVALKFLPSEIRGDPVALDDLRRETARSHKLTHPNIVRIHDLHEDPDGTAFIVMEYVDGPTLAALRLEQPNRVCEWNFLRPLLEQLCAALDYAHREKVIHRDLKPANMMVDGKGRLKLADFGIAAVASDSMSRVFAKHSTSGTLLYMSPQQLAGRRPQATDDIYALGATLYELLTGKPPFYTGDITHQVLHEPPEPMEERLAALEIQNEIPPDAAALIMACLGKEPGQRPQSALAVAEWIGLEVVCKPSTECLAAALFPQTPSSPAEAVEAEPAGTRASTPAGYGWKLAGVGVVLLVMAGAAYWLGKSGPRVDNANVSLAAKVQGQAVPGSDFKTSLSKLPVRDGLVLYFSFDQPPSGGVVRDESGTGNDGQVVGAKWTSEGKSGGGMVFSPTDCYISVSNNESLNPAHLTLAAWIKTPGTDGAWRRIFDKDYVRGFALSVTGDGPPDWKPLSRLRGHVTFEVNHQEIHSDHFLSDRQWHHIAATYDGSTQRMFVDGLLQQDTHTPSGRLERNEFNLRVGGYVAPDPVSDNPRNSFEGVLDEVMVFNRVLSPGEILQLYETAGGAPLQATAIPAPVQIKEKAISTTLPAVRLNQNETWVFTTIAGKAGAHGMRDGIGSYARFDSPEGIAVDRKGNLFVAEYTNHTIRLIKPSGVVSTFAGLAGTPGTNDGVATDARFGWPRGVAVDRIGNIYVADSGNCTIRKITPLGSVTTFAGQAGKRGSDDGSAAIARFNSPIRIAIGPDGNLFVTDLGNNTIRKITSDGVVSTLAGQAGVKGSMEGLGPSARFYRPYGIAVGGQGFVYVTDSGNATIRVINPSGVVSTLAGQPGVYGSADGATTSARFGFSRDVVVDRDGNLYAVDSGNTVRRITSTGVVTTVAGLAGRSGSRDGAGSFARFHDPQGIALDTQGNLYVTEFQNYTIRKGHRQRTQP